MNTTDYTGNGGLTRDRLELAVRAAQLDPEFGKRELPVGVKILKLEVWHRLADEHGVEAADRIEAAAAPLLARGERRAGYRA